MDPIQQAVAALQKKLADEMASNIETVEKEKKAMLAEIEEVRNKANEEIKVKQAEWAKEEARLKAEWDWVQHATGMDDRDPKNQTKVKDVMSQKPGQLVRLNVGGVPFDTTLTTLRGDNPDSMLAAMFSGRHPFCLDDNKRYFIDRDGRLFGHVLNYLRRGFISIPEGKSHLLPELEAEAEYFQLPGLKAAIQSEAGDMNCKMQFLCCVAATAGASGAYWTWQRRSGSAEFGCNGQNITLPNPGRFVVFCRVVGVSAGNNGFAQLSNGQVACQSWHNHANGNYNQVSFNQLFVGNGPANLNLINSSLQNTDYNLATASNLSILALPDQYPYMVATANTVSGAFYCWQPESNVGNCIAVNQQNITLQKAGVYLVLTRVCGNGSGNAGHVQITLGGQPKAQCWMNDASNFKKSALISEVVETQQDNVQIQIQNTSYTPSGYSTHTGLAIIGLPLKAQYVTFGCSANVNNSTAWQWQQRAGKGTVAVVQNGSNVVVQKKGVYLVLIRLIVNNNGGSGYCDLQLNGSSIGQGYSYDANSWSNTVHFNEVMELPANSSLCVFNRLGTNTNTRSEFCNSFTLLHL